MHEAENYSPYVIGFLIPHPASLLGVAVNF